MHSQNALLPLLVLILELHVQVQPLFDQELEELVDLGGNKTDSFLYQPILLLAETKALLSRGHAFFVRNG